MGTLRFGAVVVDEVRAVVTGHRSGTHSLVVFVVALDATDPVGPAALGPVLPTRPWG